MYFFHFTSVVVRQSPHDKLAVKGLIDLGLSRDCMSLIADVFVMTLYSTLYSLSSEAIAGHGGRV